MKNTGLIVSFVIK